MNWQTQLRRAMRTYNDYRALSNAAETGNPQYITNRIGRRLIGRMSSQLQRSLFPPIRRRRQP